MSEVSKSFNCSVPLLNAKWEIEHGNVRDLARRSKAAASAAEAAAAVEAASAAEAAATAATAAIETATTVADA
jgi:hypothetical protein